MRPAFRLPEEPLFRRLRRSLARRFAARPDLRRGRPGILSRGSSVGILPWILGAFLLRGTWRILGNPELTTDGRLASLALLHLVVCGFLSLSYASILAPDSLLLALAHWPASEEQVLDRQGILLRRRIAWTGLAVLVAASGLLWALPTGTGPSAPVLGLVSWVLQYGLAACLGVALVRRGGAWLVLTSVSLALLAWVASLFGLPVEAWLVGWMNRSGDLLGHVLPTAWILQPWIALRDGAPPQWWRWLPALVVPWAAFKSWQELRHAYGFRERILLETYGEAPLDADEETVAALDEARSRPRQPARSEIEERIRSRAFLAEDVRLPRGWIERAFWRLLTARERLLMEWISQGAPEWTRRARFSWVWLACVAGAGLWLRHRGEVGLHALVWLGGFLLAATQFLPLGPTLPAFPLDAAPVLPREELRLRDKAGAVRALAGLPQAVAFGLLVGFFEPDLPFGHFASTGFAWAMLSSQMPGLHWANTHEGPRSGGSRLRRWSSSAALLAAFGLFACSGVACALVPRIWLPVPLLAGLACARLAPRWMLRRIEANRGDIAA